MSALVEVMRPTRGRGGTKEETVREERVWSWNKDDILMSALNGWDLTLSREAEN